MKILIFAASFPLPAVGGSVEYLLNIIKYYPKYTAIINTGNEFPDDAKTFDKNFPQKIIRNNFIHHPMEAYKRHKFQRACQYIIWPFSALRLIFKTRPDVIHIGEGNTAAVAAMVARFLIGTPYIHFVYAEEILLYKSNKIREYLFWLCVKGAQGVITVSEYSRELLISGGVNPLLIHKIIPSVGFDKYNYLPPEKILYYKNKYNLKSNHIILTVGVLKERKGHSSALMALKLLVNEFPDIRYIIVGGGERELFLKKLVHELALDDHVIFTGRQENEVINCLYRLCDIFLMPHREVTKTKDTEGCPTVFLEASAHGKPVIGGNAGGVSDAILNNITGYIIDGNNEELIANKISLLLNNPELARSLGAAGKEYSSYFTPEINSRKVFDISIQATKTVSVKF